MNPLSRKYNKRVEIWKTSQVSDGFGGYTTTTALLMTVWMNVRTNIGTRATDLGITDVQNTVLFELRYRPGIDAEDTFFRYKGEDYVLQAPSNLNEMNSEIIVYGTR